MLLNLFYIRLYICTRICVAIKLMNNIFKDFVSFFVCRRFLVRKERVHHEIWISYWFS